MIRIEHLTKYYGKTLALDDLNLEIPPGEFFGFLGLNGAGKTTTIKIIVGLLRASAGKVILAGTDQVEYDIAIDSEKAKAITGYIPDSPFLYDKLTGYEYVHFTGGLYGIPTAKIDEHIKKYFSLFNLMDAAHYLIESYSHGMRQKVVMAGALVHDPKVLVVDEPMVGLDPRSSRLVKDLLKRKSREGVTIFLSTHTLDIAEELCDRIGIIQKGKLAALGTMEELRNQAKDTSSDLRLESVFLKLTEEENEGLYT
ncbi:MAG: ABC transporter ATP-binding protein [Candidatus Omnitrophota bacterium]|jgi:ABC-2 type transport system ATP-binding protein|nr:MAG: ABC transporter ATP-binding protein [Candidatus Omnitrophota bacterium]